MTGATTAVGTTEGTQSYTTDSMGTATRLNLSIRETPQSVTVVTRQRIQDQGLATVNDVVSHGDFGCSAKPRRTGDLDTQASGTDGA